MEGIKEQNIKHHHYPQHCTMIPQYLNIQEVLSKEINVAAVATRYYDVIAEK